MQVRVLTWAPDQKSMSDRNHADRHKRAQQKQACTPTTLEHAATCGPDYDANNESIDRNAGVVGHTCILL